MDALIGKTRALNAIELAELFFAIERNSIGFILLMGFIQVVKNKEVKEYLKKEKN